MKNSKAIWIVLVLLVLGWIVTSSKDKSPDKKVTIGITQITSHPVMDELVAGIKEGLSNAGYVEGETVVYDHQNAQGDQTVNQSIAQKFADSSYDLFIPISTPSSQAIANVIKDRPVVFGAVTDPVSAGLVASKENPGGNVTGTSDITLYKEQLDLLKKIVPNAKKIGVVYNPGEANARFALDETKKFAALLGMEVITAPANRSAEILSAAKSLVDKVDVFYMLPDNTVVSGQEALISVALEAKKPLITVDQSGVEAGGLATLGTNYKMVGVRTAELVIKVLEGANPATTPVIGVTDADIFVNLKTAAKIGITLPVDLVNSAKQKYE